MVQNTSHAVMSQRIEPRDSLDDFPTPPWATRALLEYIIGPDHRHYTCLEPACGVGHMAVVLKEYFKEVVCSDVHDYGYGAVRSYLSLEVYPPHDWVITNPPFKLAEQFVYRSFNIATVGIALLTRTVFTESVGRYHNLFSWRPPAFVAQFVERVPMVQGRLDGTATTATAYAWVVWNRDAINGNSKITQLIWIPPCRKRLERPLDYLSQFFPTEKEKA